MLCEICVNYEFIGLRSGWKCGKDRGEDPGDYCPDFDELDEMDDEE